MANWDVAKMASMVGAKPCVYELIASAFTSPMKRIQLQDDESYQDNVKLIKSYVGENVTITKDMPPIHESTALEIGNNKLLQKVEAEMKLAMIEAVKAVKKYQKENGKYISWRKLQQIFDGNEMYFPDVDKDVQRYDSIIKDETFVKFSGAPSLQAMEEAEKLMRKVVNNQHIWDSLKINKETIKQAFGAEGVAVSSVDDVFARSEKCAHIAIDIGVVRFPRPEDPFFKLYRFRVIVFKSEIAIACLNKKGSGIFVNFRCRTYKMTDAWNSQFTQELKEKVSAKFHSAMSDLLGGL